MKSWGGNFPTGVLSQAQMLYLNSDHDHERVNKQIDCAEEFWRKGCVTVGAILIPVHLTD